MDDVWILGTSAGTDVEHEAAGWAAFVQRRREAYGVENNAAKAVDAAEWQEIKGAQVDPELHTVGLSPER
eukprot:11217228-Lingulodinium_polyedra.AAC.1